MNYERLKTFITVTEKKSFSDAAKILHVTQPTITGQIKLLEEELQTKLFERTTKRIELTQSAEILLTYAKEIVRLSESAQKKIVEIEETIHGDLSIGCSLTIGEYILPRYLKRFIDMYPLIQIRVKITNSSNIIDGLKDHIFDVGLIEVPISDDSVIMQPLLEDELFLITAPDHFTEYGDAVSLKQLKKLPFILREKGSGTREVVSIHLQQAGISMEELNIIMELDSTEAIKSAVESGLGVSLISEYAIKKERQLGLLSYYKIMDLSFTRNFYMVYRKEQVMKATAEAFIHDLEIQLYK
ncbi:selenium metabolism-associated LysR family transcriptional regulator [Oceanobacillus massiliensis]|uniref:selenium metabolism-associated LysR family transcriptional regulator n=1 Tax=Oceanobacillus massiliensis TaxID=1465765 RepID=UPI00028888F4|nr:selenium metabolism-associated LysR family transcriptional regulator [Oceanobacillus massiliensis]